MARLALREIDQALLAIGDKRAEISSSASPEGRAVYLGMAIDPGDLVRLADSDGEITGRTLAATTSLARPVRLVTGDTGQRPVQRLGVTVLKTTTPVPTDD